MPQIAIIVEFETLPGKEAQAGTVIREHAKRTIADEPGCLRFEVLHVVDENGAHVPNRLMVSELYVDAAAVATHRGTERIKQVGATLGPLLAHRRLIMAEVDA